MENTAESFAIGIRREGMPCVGKPYADSGGGL
jgi:hypothetical protein